MAVADSGRAHALVSGVDQAIRDAQLLHDMRAAFRRERGWNRQYRAPIAFRAVFGGA